MRWTVSVALSATVLIFGLGFGLGLGFGVGANLGAASATRLVVEKVLSLRDRFLILTWIQSSRGVVRALLARQSPGLTSTLRATFRWRRSKI